MDANYDDNKLLVRGGAQKNFENFMQK